MNPDSTCFDFSIKECKKVDGHLSFEFILLRGYQRNTLSAYAIEVSSVFQKKVSPVHNTWWAKVSCCDFPTKLNARSSICTRSIK